MSASRHATRPASAGIRDRFEYTTGADPFRNYCLWDYAPPAPSEDKYRSVNLLYQSFDLAGLDARAFELVEHLRQGIGPFQTVFGIKLVEQQLGWEFYFYDYRRLEREVSMSRVLEVMRPVARCSVAPEERLPYFMFSVDVDQPLLAGERSIEPIHMYVGNVGSPVSAGIAYALRPDSRELENFYFFFDAKTQARETADKICCSAWVDASRLRFEDLLWPELRDCDTICVANKRFNDCVYYSGVNVDQLLVFLKRLRYPQRTVSFVEESRHLLDHLRFDVGLDYRMEQGRIRIVKSGYYGVF